jgi:hypothetical protein
MSVLESADCVFTIMKPSDYIGCIADALPGAWLAIYFGLLLVFLVGFIAGIGLERGLAVGGAIGTLLAIGFIALDLISIVHVFWPIILMMAGALFLTIDKAG